MASVPPRITPFSFEDNPLHEGQYTQINCLVAEGDLPIEIDWELNGKKVNEFVASIAKVGKRSSLLTIETVSYANIGNYSCKARNQAGHSEFITQLQVNGYCPFCYQNHFLQCCHVLNPSISPKTFIPDKRFKLVVL